MQGFPGDEAPRKGRSGRERKRFGRALLGAQAVLLVFTAPSAAACIPLDLISVYDGDTLRAWVDGENTPVRLLGYDTAEIGHRARCLDESEMAIAAHQRLVELIESAGAAELCPAGRDRYRRLLAALVLDGEDVAAVLIAEGLARPWTGRRESWCDD